MRHTFLRSPLLSRLIESCWIEAPSWAVKLLEVAPELARHPPDHHLPAAEPARMASRLRLR